MDSPYWNVIIRGGSDTTASEVSVEMVVPTNVYSSVFQHLALISRQLDNPVLARGVDETKGGQVAWLTVDADEQTAAIEPMLIPTPSEHATGKPEFTATPESQPPPPASTNWALPPGDGPTPPINGWTPPAPRHIPAEPLPIEKAPTSPIPSPAQTIAGFDQGASEMQPPAVPGRARGSESPGFSTTPVPLNASPPSIPQVPANAPPSWRQGFAPREQPVFPSIPQPPDTQVTPIAPSPSVLFMRPPKAMPQGGFRRAMYRLTVGRMNLGPNQAQLRVIGRDARISRSLTRPYGTAFLSFKGGIGETSTTVGVELTLAQIQDAPPIAIDASPGSGGLTERLLGEKELLCIHPHNITDLVRDIPRAQAWTGLTGYIMQIDRLHILAGEQGPMVSDSLTAGGYTRIHDLVRRLFSVILTDCGTGVAHNAISGIPAKVGDVTITAGHAVSGAKRAVSTLGWLAQHGYARLTQEALIVLTDRDGVSTQVWKDTVRGHLVIHSRQAFAVPNDPAAADGDRTGLARVHPRTREVQVEVAAAVIDGYR